MRAYFDSDVLIWHLRGANQAEGFFYNFSKKKEFSLWIGAMQRAEIVFFMRENEKETTTSFLSQFNCAIVDKEIIDKIAKKKNISKKKIIENAVFLFWDKINSEKDNNIFENSFGSWTREDSIKDTVKKSRQAFNDSFNRYLEKE